MAGDSELRAADSAAFIAFPPETQQFLASLRENNDRGWFEANRAAYDAYYVAPARAFVTTAGDEIRRFCPEVHAEPRILGSIFRITHDSRYGRADRPFKDHLDFYFWEGARKAAVSGFFMRVGTDFVGIGAGCHGFERDELALFRDALADGEGGAALAAIAGTLEGRGYVLRGEHYRRDPKGFEANDEARRFLRFKALYVHARHPAELATEPGAVLREAARLWRDLAPMHRWLTDWIQARRKPA